MCVVYTHSSIAFYYPLSYMLMWPMYRVLFTMATLGQLCYCYCSMFLSVYTASAQPMHLLYTTQALLLWMLRGPGYQPGLTYGLGPSHP